MSISQLLTINKEIMPLQKTFYDPGYKTIERFLKNANRHLKNKGQVLFVFSPVVGDQNRLFSLIKENDFSLSILIEKKIDEVPWKIYELKKISV